MNKQARWHDIEALPLGADDEELLGLKAVYRIIRYRFRVMIACLAIGIGLALLYLVTATPQYSATTQLYIDTRAKKTIDIGEVVPGLGSDAAALDSEVEVIKSTSVARRVIEALNAENGPGFEPSTKESSLLSKLTGFLGLSSGEAEVETPPASENKNQIEEMAQQLAKNLDVERIGLTYVISISYTSPDPLKSAAVTNQVAESYLVHQLEAKFEATKRASDWLSDRLQSLQAKVKESQKAVELYRARHNLVGDAQETPYEDQLKKLNEELALAQVHTDRRFAELQQAKKIVEDKGELTSIDAVAKSDVVGKLREALAIVAKEEGELTTRFTNKHPKVLNKRGERRDLERQIAKEAKAIVLNLENEYDISRLRQISLEKSLQELKDKTKAARSSLIELRELELEAEANSAVYRAFLNRFKETSQQETLRSADSRIITKATPPASRSSPKTALTLGLALVVSSVVGIGLILLFEHLDESFKTDEQIEDKLNMTCLAMLPEISNHELKAKNGPIPIDRMIMAQPISAYAEAIRTLKVNIQLSNTETPAKVVMITSSQPNEGKTTVAANLARHAAQTGLRTLLIDGDLRNPSLSSRLLQRPAPGLVEVLTQKHVLEKVILRDSSGADFLPSSRLPAHAAEVLGSRGMVEILEWAKEAYDFVLIDTAPVSSIVDARVLAHFVDGVVFVIEWDQTAQDAAETAMKSLRISRKKVIGAVLNKVNIARMASYRGDNYGLYDIPYPPIEEKMKKAS